MIKPWKKLKEELVFSDFRKIHKTTFELEPGKIKAYDILIDPRVSTILALTPENQVIMAVQFRPGPGKVLMELPAGIVDEGETPLEAAKRELLEETGYAGDMQFVTTTWHGSYSTMMRYHFVATNCKKIKEPDAGEDEIIDVKLESIENFKKHIKTGELTNVDTSYLGLDFLGLL